MTRLPYQSSGCWLDRRDHERAIREQPPGSVTLALCDRVIARIETDLLEAEDWMLGDQPELARQRLREDLAAWRIERTHVVRMAAMET